MKKIREEHQRKLDAKEREVSTRERASEDKVRTVEEMLRHTERDGDKEVMETKARYERTLKEEREANVRLRGEAGILRKRFAGAARDGEEHRTAIQRLGADNARLASTIRYKGTNGGKVTSFNYSSNSSNRNSNSNNSKENEL